MGADSEADKLPSPEALRVYEIFRRRIVEEDSLINNRISWLIWLQASLIAAWGVIASGHNLRGVDKFYLLIFLGFFGFVMSAAVLASILAAHIEIRRCKLTYKTEFRSLYYDQRIPRITGNKRAHGIGHIVPFAAPVMFCLAQLVLIYSDLRLGKDEQSDVPQAQEMQLPVITAPAKSATDRPAERQQ